MITPAQENERMLARILGIGEDEAATRLCRTVRITAAEGEASLFAAELRAQLERTIAVVDAPLACDIEVLIHAAPESDATELLTINIQTDRVIAGGSDIPEGPAGSLHGVQRVIGACYVASVVLSRLIDGVAPAALPDPFVIEFGALGATRAVLEAPIDLAETVLAGAGAVGNGFLRAARHLAIRGKLTVLDPKAVGAGNPNRCLYFDNRDVDHSKAEILCAKAAGDFPALALHADIQTFQSYVERFGAVRRVIVATDSREVRRHIQSCMPLEVLDASTTGVDEVIVHSHRQPTEDACLACIYHFIPDELARQKAIAAGLGIDLADITGSPFISAEVAARIVAQHPDLDAGRLVNMAFESLYKQRCAEQALRSPAGEQIFAPFAFVSNLAGALLALELARMVSGQREREGKNYLFASPWAPPTPRLRRTRPRVPTCTFCSKPTTARVWPLVWPNWGRPAVA